MGGGRRWGGEEEGEGEEQKVEEDKGEEEGERKEGETNKKSRQKKPHTTERSRRARRTCRNFPGAGGAPAASPPPTRRSPASVTIAAANTVGYAASVADFDIAAAAAARVCHSAMPRSRNTSGWNSKFVGKKRVNALIITRYIILPWLE